MSYSERKWRQLGLTTEAALCLNERSTGPLIKEGHVDDEAQS
jgi:hypothetical protein